MVSSATDCLYVDWQKKFELDVDETYEVTKIKSLIYDAEEGAWYILANKYEEKLGFFVLKLFELEPEKGRFLIRWRNKLENGNPNIFVLRDKKQGLKELIVSYKTIFMNIYNVISMDISIDDE